MSTWVDDLVDWLKDEGLKILIWLLIGIVALILWRIICSLLIKGMTLSGIKARETILRSKYAASSSGLKFTSGLKKGFRALSASKDDIKEAEDEEIGDKSGLLKTTKKSVVSISTTDDKNVLDDEIQKITVSEEVRTAMTQRAETIGGVLRSVGNFIIVVVMSVSILDIIGLPTESLLTGAALIGLALALAVQTIVGDFVSGVFILSENLYFQGEEITIGETTGIVENLTLRVTTLRGEDGKLHTIPNGDIREITNSSRDYSMTEVIISIPYSGEKDYINARDCLEDIIPKALQSDDRFNDRYLLEPPQVSGIEALGEDAIKIKYSAKVRAGSSDNVRDAMMTQIRLEFPKANIHIKGIE